MKNLTLAILFFTAHFIFYVHNCKAQDTPTEKRVREKLYAGSVVDMNDTYFRGRKEISAEFIESLFADSVSHKWNTSRGISIRHATIKGYIDLSNIHFTHKISLTDCNFSDTLDLFNAHIDNYLILNGSVFHNPVNFYYSYFKILQISSCHFCSAINFAELIIGKDLECSNSTFDSSTIFRAIKVNNAVVFNNTVFDSVFYFDATEIGGDAWFNNVTFNDIVNFNYSKIKGSLILNAATFTDSASFASLKVLQNIFLDHATCLSDMSFIAAEIGCEFSANSLTFSDNDKTTISLNSAIINGHIMITNMKNRLDYLDLSHAKINGNLQLTDDRINRAIFDNTTVGNNTLFYNTTFKHYLSLRFASLGVINITSVQYPQPDKDSLIKDPLLMDGLSYKSLIWNNWNINNSVDSLKKFRDLINNAKFNADNYTTFESYLKAEGYQDLADDVYDDLKKHNRNFLGYLFKFLFYNGRSPWLAFAWSLLVIFAGWFIFREQNNMKLKKPELEDYPYHPFWYSFDLFFPFVNFMQAEAWMPKPEHKFLVIYSRIHTLLGWILIPIGLAYITGLIK